METVQGLDLPVKLVVDSKMNVEETFKPSEILFKGATNKSVFSYTATSATNQNIVFNNITPPSLQTCVERTLRIQYTLELVSVAPNATLYDSSPLAMNSTANGALVAGSTHTVCLRAWPLYSCCSSLELKINGNSTSVSPWDIAPLYPHLLHQDELQEFSSEFPCQKDNSAAYALYAAGDNKNPLALPSANSYIPSRSSFLWTLITQVAGGTNTTSTFAVQVTEQLVISPMLYGNRMNLQALANVNNITLNMRIADISRVLSHAPFVTGSITSIGLQPNTQPVLLVEYSTPDPILSARMPPQLTYDYETVQPYTTSIGNINNASPAATKAFQTMQLPSIPNKLFIYLKPTNGWAGDANSIATDNSCPDIFLRITKLNVQFGNRVGLFSTFTEQDLYKMSVANGLKDSYEEWKYQCGSICIVDVQKDIGLDADEDVGQSNRYTTLQVTATYESTPLQYAGVAGTNCINFTAYCTVTTPGKAIIDKSSCAFVTAGVSASDVLAVTANPDAHKVSEHDLNMNAQGGSIFGRMGKFLHNGLSVAKSVHEAIKPEHLQQAQSMLKKLTGSGTVGAGTVGGYAKHRRVM